MELKESLKKLPKQPGIYLMKNSLDMVIYVGKAKNLKSRVSQYFQKNKNNSKKVSEMIERICTFEYITTNNKQRIIRVSKYGRNTLATEKYGDVGVKLFLIKGNKLLHIELVNFSEYNVNTLEERLRNLIMTHFKAFKKERIGGLSQEDIDEAQIIHSYLKNKRNGIWSINIPISRIDEINYRKIIELSMSDLPLALN